MRKFMNKKIKGYLKPAVSAALAGLLTIALAACGREENGPAQEEMPEYVYVPEYIEISGENGSSFYNSKLVGNSLYYLGNSFDEEAMESKTELCKLALDGAGEPEGLPVQIPGERSVNDFAIDGEGNIYTVQSDYSANKTTEEGYSAPDVFLTKYNAGGEAVYEQDITEVLNEDPENTYVNSMAVDAQGRIYLCVSSAVRLFDAEGGYRGSIDNNDNWINNLGAGKDGKVYFAYYDSTSSNGGMVLAEADFDACKTGSTFSGFIGGNGGNGLSAGGEKDFLVQDGTKLYEYDLNAQSAEEVLTWLDSDINGQYVDSVGALEDGRLIALISDWNTGDTEVALLTKTKSSELAQKEQITIGTLYSDQSLQAAAVAFNKSSDKYHVNIKNYIDTNNWTETSYEDGITNLNNDITSGSNSPDILDLSQLNAEQLASKGVFEDLMPYLEKSTVLDKDDFMKNILDSFQFDGRLAAIPTSFAINTVIGKSSEVGEEMGWTLDEMIAYADTHEGAALFDNASRGSILAYCLNYNMDAFVDWNAGTCNFDTPEFKKLLEFVNRFPDEADWETDQRSQPAKIAAGDVLLADVYLYDFNNIQEYIAMFNEPVTAIGFPTMDGSAGVMLQANSLYAIASKSEHKEGAWAFIEHYLAEYDTGSIFANGFPSRQSKFDERVEEVTRVEYVLDENGEPLTDENGEAIAASGMAGISYGDWEYTYHTPTKEEVDMLRELIEVAKPAVNSSQEINTIISEEAEAFYKGQKSVDEVVKVIQSRAQIYVSENS